MVVTTQEAEIEGKTAAELNSCRVEKVVDQLNLHVSSNNGGTKKKDDDLEFYYLCLSLSRGIDYSVANNEVPSKVQDLPELLKKVCQCKTLLLQPGIMVLMLSVKSACMTGWFSNEDSRKLLTLVDEVGSSFSSIRELDTEVGKYGPKDPDNYCEPGFGTYLTDFSISKKMKRSGEEKIRLFVAQVDNLETSSCLISPPQANFLINGKGVERRTSVSMVGGPLLPTIITPLLKFGTNILQVLGQFAGNYVIVVAFMSMTSSLDISALQDYVQPEVAVHDQDSELVEGPSRISLNCPISCTRMKTPVKGHSCKHIQCFDFDNFVEINSRRPWWRCPCCNQYVSYVDLRVNRYMAKVLNEVQEDVSEVIISADESWKPFTKGYKSLPAQGKSSKFSYSQLDMMDLTEGDDDADNSSPIKIQDIKPMPAEISNQSEVENVTVSLGTNNPNIVGQNDVDHIDADFWSRLLMSTYLPGGPGPTSQPRMFGDISGSVSGNLQSQFGNSIGTNENANPPITRPRVQVAQALQTQSPTLVTEYPLSNHNSPRATSSVGDSFNTKYGMLERQMQNCRSRLNILQTSRTRSSNFNPVNVHSVNSPSLPQFQTQNWCPRNSFSPCPLAPPNPLATTSPRLSPRVLVEHQNVYPDGPHPILAMSHSQNPNTNRFSTQTTQDNIHFSQQQMQSAQEPNYVVTGRPALNQLSRAMPSPSVGSANVLHTEESSWRPTSRMRGALQGQAYSAAHQQFIFQPVQAARPSAEPVSTTSVVVPDPTSAS